MRKLGVCVAVIGVLVTGCGGTGEPEKSDDDIALETCKAKIDAQLKAPSTAKYIGVDVRTSSDGGTWIVDGVVAAENSFGGTVEDDFKCILRPSESGDLVGDGEIFTDD